MIIDNEKSKINELKNSFKFIKECLWPRWTRKGNKWIKNRTGIWKLLAR